MIQAAAEFLKSEASLVMVSQLFYNFTAFIITVSSYIVCTIATRKILQFQHDYLEDLGIARLAVEQSVERVTGNRIWVTTDERKIVKWLTDTYGEQYKL